MNESPEECRGHDRGRPCPRPTPEELPGQVFRVPHFSFHRQGSYAEANGCRKPLQVVRFGGYGLLSPPVVPDLLEEPAGYQLLNSRRKAAPGAERPAGSLEVGGRGGNGRRQRRPRPRGRLTTTGGKLQRRVSVRPGRGWSL